MLDRDAVAERVTKGGGHRGRQGNLWHQDQHAASACADRRGEPQIDFGLAAAGDAVQQRDPEITGGRQSEQASERGVLLRGQLPCQSGVRLHSGTTLTRV